VGGDAKTTITGATVAAGVTRPEPSAEGRGAKTRGSDDRSLVASTPRARKNGGAAEAPAATRSTDAAVRA
jgi:hypothetical protein